MIINKGTVIFLIDKDKNIPYASIPVDEGSCGSGLINTEPLRSPRYVEVLYLT